MSDNKKKSNETLIFVFIGSLLLIISFLLFHYEKIIEVNNNIKSSIQAEIYKEKSEKSKLAVDISVDYIEQNEINNSDNTQIEDNDVKNNSNYIAFLEIDKINLRQGLLPKENYYNYVDYHVQILDISDYPDVINGNFILAGHSGTSSVAFFKNLYKLELGDEAKIYYDGKLYKYSIVNIYKEDKDGSINVYRDRNKTTLTLITCSKDDKLHQTIYILELLGVETY